MEIQTTEDLKQRLADLRASRQKLVSAAAADISDQIIRLEREVVAAESESRAHELFEIDRLMPVLQDILALSIRITTKGYFTVFCEYSGHVDWISVRVFEGLKAHQDTAWQKRIDLKYTSLHETANEVKIFLTYLDEMNELPVNTEEPSDY